MIFEDWQNRHAIPPEAMEDLCRVMGVHDCRIASTSQGESESESWAQDQVRLKISESPDAWVSRNNVGSLRDSVGRWVRFGLSNESKAANQTMKSSDLIGCRSVTITQAMVGKKIGQFIAREMKKPGWIFGEDEDREIPQLRFINFINSMGGDAAFSTGELDFSRMLPDANLFEEFKHVAQWQLGMDVSCFEGTQIFTDEKTELCWMGFKAGRGEI